MRRCALAILLVPFSVGLVLSAVVDVQGREPKEAALEPVTAAGQAKEAKQVDILTVDRVELKGKYYPSDRDKVPCVLLLHAFGDSSSGKEWTNLAKKLNAQGYPVLMFDFRGHGDSTTVRPGTPANPKIGKMAERGFWDEELNWRGVKGFAPNKPRPTEIKFEQFKPEYCTVLANDIAAAKAWLDERPDCNSSNLILIGANDGATLGALWLNSEFHRYRVLPQAPGQFGQPQLDAQNPEGLAVKAAVWLSIGNTFGINKKAFDLAPMLDWQVRTYKVPTLFVYGEGDSKGGEVAKKLYDKLLPAKVRKGYPHIDVLKIAGAEQMSGKKLLLESLDTTAKILKFAEDVPDSKLAATPRKALDEVYFWQYDGSRSQILARKRGADRVEFNSYVPFLR